MLLERAREVGLRMSVEEGQLVVQGPRRAGDLAEQVLAHKGEVLALLSADTLPRIPVIPRNTDDATEGACPCALCSGVGETGIPEDEIEHEATCRAAEVVLAAQRAAHAVRDLTDNAETTIERFRTKIAAWYDWRDEHWDRAPALLEAVGDDLKRQVRALRGEKTSTLMAALGSASEVG
jgi:hypothetical protein